jgi:hypothetical protein
MSEVEALLTLYGAIDRAVKDGEADADALATLLSPYGKGAAGWYDEQFLPWLAAAPERAEQRRRYETSTKSIDRAEPPPTYPEAGEYATKPAAGAESPQPAGHRLPLSPRAQEVSDALGAFEARRLEGRMGTRRLLAVTAAARAMPERFGPDGSHADVANTPLVFHHPELADDPVDRAESLHGRFASDFTSMKAWEGVVQSSVAANLLPESFMSHASAPPCTGRLILRPGPDGTDPDPCTVLEAEFTTDKVTFEEAKHYLEPSNWVLPADSLWCRMEKVEPPLTQNSWVYHETVATSCPASSTWWTVSTDLRFWFSYPTPNEVRVEYDFPPGLPTPGSDIEIDEGSLRIIELPNKHIHVITTKRVRFAGAFDGAGLAMFMCATGYSSALEDMVFSVAKLPNAKPFPIRLPQGGTVSPQPNPKKTATNTSATTTPPDASSETLNDVVEETTNFVASYIKDMADTCTSSLQKIQGGKYKIEDAWADGIKMWSTYTDGVAKALNLSTRAVKASAKKPASDGT